MSLSRYGLAAFLVSVCLSLAPARAQQAPVPARQESVLVAPLVKAPPKLDGVLDDAAWAQAQPLRQFAFRRKAVSYQTEAWVCRDAQNLYFAARCFDDKLKELVTAFEGSGMWKNDCLELFLVPEKRERLFTKVLVTCDGKTAGGTWVPDEWGEATRGPELKLQAATGRETNAWTVELAVPIAPFGLPITAKSVWALGFNREKHTDTEEVSGFQGGFNAPREYPDLVFDERAVVFDGIGLRNLGDQPASVRLMLSSGDKRRETGLSLPPGRRVPIDWQKEWPGLAEGQEFSIAVSAGGKALGRESYVMVAPPAPPKAGPDLSVVPPARFAKSPLDDPDFFPISVWLQPAGQAAAYKAMGVNVYVGGSDAYPNPKDAAFLDALQKQGIYTICPYKKEYVTGELYEHPGFIGWMFGDEPDNSVPETGRTRFTPEQLRQEFARIRNEDPAHPVYLNLGCGVADERFVGRAASDEEYAGFVKDCDIVSYDVYPCNSVSPDGPDRLHLVAKGIDRLRRWAGPKGRVWCWLEANKFSAKADEGRAPTPDEVKTQIWMALVHGANGYGFFCHSWFGKFTPSGIAPEMQQALAVTNSQVQALARVLNSPTVEGGAVAKPSLGSRVDCLMKRVEGATYVFAVNMYRKPEKPAISVQGVANGTAEVLNENRTVPVKGGRIVDDFAPYAVHLYKVAK